MPILSPSGELLYLGCDRITSLIDKSSRGRERPWRVYKQLSQFLAQAYSDLEWESLARRVGTCASCLLFLECSQSQVHPKKLKRANFCKDRLCTTCQWRKSMRQYHTSLKLAREALRRHSTLRFVFLTLTVPNVALRDLSGAIDDLLKSWQRLTQRKEVKSVVKGYLRALEVTYNHERDDWHPHIHAVLAVPSYYFTTSSYITQQRWLELWQEATRMPQITQVDVRTIKTKRKGVDPLEVGFAEASKYGVKPWSTKSRVSVKRLLKELYVDREDLKGHAWLRLTREKTAEVVEQLRGALEHRRLIQTGGIFRQIKRELKLKDGEDETADLVNITDKEIECYCSVCGGNMVENSYWWNSLILYYIA